MTTKNERNDGGDASRPQLKHWLDFRQYTCLLEFVIIEIRIIEYAKWNSIFSFCFVVFLITVHI